MKSQHESHAPIPQKTLDKLEWNKVLDILASFAQTEEGKLNCLALIPGKSKSDVERIWDQVVPLRDLVRSGYKAPIGELPKMHGIFKGAEKGAIFEGEDLRIIYGLLLATKKVLAFVQSFAARTPMLAELRSRLFFAGDLYTRIEKTVGIDGKLLDTASQELQLIRKQKVSLRKKIEETATKILQDPEVSTYLQDSFFTVRDDRYVIPIRIDGRGRVKGMIIDTSDSGQTLLIEPPALTQLNLDLRELDIAEKIEIIRIFREISVEVSRNLESLRQSYESLILLDTLAAQAQLAHEFDAGRVKLTDQPTLSLVLARHPLLESNLRSQARGDVKRPALVANTVALQEGQRAMIVSGPNAGGKTVVLKTVGLLHLMASSGLLIPADETSEMFLFSSIAVEMGDGQDLSASLSTFSGHLAGLRPILEQTNKGTLVLLDELANGTEPHTGAALARAMIEFIVRREATAIVTTHYDELKVIAIHDQRFRNGSMEYSEETYQSTFKLLLDVPGQSYGLEVAKQLGIPSEIIEKARTIRGNHLSALDTAVQEFQRQGLELAKRVKEQEQALIEAQTAKSRWEEECRILESERQKMARQVARKYEEDVSALKEEFVEAADQLRKVVRDVRHGGLEIDKALAEKKAVSQKLDSLDKTISSLSEAGISKELPGEPMSLAHLKLNLPVYVVPMRKEGILTKVPLDLNDPIEVQVGIIKIRVSLQDLRTAQSKRDEQQTGSAPKVPARPSISKPQIPEFVPQSPLNTYDIRGMEPDFAIDKVLQFLDKSILRGESAVVIIHGHGTDTLKTAVRSMLKLRCPYPVAFRVGVQGEGGDGVTVIGLAHQ